MQLTVYSSAPLTTQLACAFQGIKRLGVQVVLRPLADVPSSPAPRRRRSALLAERTSLHIRLAAIGDALNQFETGLRGPDAGQEQGLKAERDSLLSRVRGLDAALAAPGGAEQTL